MFKKILGEFLAKTMNEERIRKDLIKLIEDIKRDTINCEECPLFYEGCKAKDYEAISKIIEELLKVYPHETIISTRQINLGKEGNYSGIIFLPSGASMYPSMEEGEILIYTGLGKIKEGDVIGGLITKGGEKIIVIHRVIGEDENFYFVRGDNNTLTEKISKKTVIGKVALSIKKSKEPELYDRIYDAIWRNKER